jgi:hypothetical protein
MSNTSPVNPFSPSTAYSPTVDGSGGQMSGFTKALLIIFLVLGVLGIFGSLMAVVQLVIGSAVSANMAGPADGDAAQVPNVNLNVFPGALAIQIAMQMVAILLSTLMVISAAMGLKHRISGLNLVRWTTAGLIVYKVVEQILGVIITFAMFDQVKTQALEQMNKAPNQPDIDMGQVMDIMLYVGLAFGIFWTLGMIILYLVIFLHAGKPAVRAKFH